METLYGQSNAADKRLIDSLDALLWAIKNPNKVDYTWRLRVLENAQKEILYSINGCQDNKCNGICKPTVMSYDQNCPLHGWV